MRKLAKPAPFLALFFIRFYQLTLGVFFGGACRFQPNCSEYAVQAYQNFGFFRATKLTFQRVFKCHPWGDFGYDPIPLDEVKDGQ